MRIFLSDDVTISFKAFLNTFLYYFHTAFPTEMPYVKNNNKNKWLPKGLIVSRNRMQFFNWIKRSTNISLESLHYINRY